MEKVLVGVVVLVFGIIVAAVDSSIRRNCVIKDAGTVDLGPLPKPEGLWLPNSSLVGVEKIVVGLGPEDVAFDSQGRIYTGLDNGWIKRIEVNGTINDLAYVGGRPLGVIVGPSPAEEIYVAEPHQGLFKISNDGKVHHLSSQVNGQQLKFANGVVVTRDGTVYFTEASAKFGIKDFHIDMLTGRGNGRVLKYDPTTSTTSVVLTDLAFANGIALSTHEDFFVVAETFRGRVWRYWLKGEKQGTSEIFLDGLPRYVDNIRLCDQHFYIGLSGVRTMISDWIFKIPSRSLRCIIERPRFLGFVFNPSTYGGLLVVNQDGKIVTKYEDPTGSVISFVTSAIKVGNSIYVGGLDRNFIGLLKL